MDEIRQSVRLSSIELHLVAAAAQDKLTELDARDKHIQADIADTGGESYSGWQPAIQNIAGMRRIYQAIVQQVEQALDVPFLTSEDARIALSEAGVVFVGGDPLVAA